MFEKRRRELTEKETAWLKEHYKHTKNGDIAERLGISGTHLAVLARTLGLKKSRQFTARMQANAKERADEWRRRLKEEDPEAYEEFTAKARANLDAHRHETVFRKGEGPKPRMTEEAWAERSRKCGEALAALRRRDRARTAIGLKPLTRLSLGYPSKERFALYQRKWHLRKAYGYIPGEGLTVYYDEGTRRSSMEHLYVARYGFRFEPLGVEKVNKEVKLPPSWEDKQGGLNTM